MLLSLLDIIALGPSEYKHSYLVTYLDPNRQQIGDVVHIYYHITPRSLNISRMLQVALESKLNHSVSVIKYTELM